MDVDEAPGASSLVTVKEEQFDFEEDEMKYEPPKRGRTRSLSKKTADKVDIKAKLERSRQSARECRARKKLRYQYLEEIISETEKAIFSLRRELEMLKLWGTKLDENYLPENLIQYRTSCVEKKLSHPFTLQQHHHAQIAEQRQQAAETTGMNIVGDGTSGGICISPSSSLGLSLSPTGHLKTPYMTTLRSKRSPSSNHNISPTSSSSISQIQLSTPPQ